MYYGLKYFNEIAKKERKWWKKVCFGVYFAKVAAKVQLKVKVTAKGT